MLRRIIEFWIEVLCRKRDRGEKDVCCLDPPPEIRARTDPYIYSQFWLWLRGIAFVWDNPDFTIIDAATTNPVNNHHVIGSHDYLVRALIHNGSLMTAFGTKVTLRVLEFGAGGLVVSTLGTVTLDVPGAGTAVAELPWHTPPGGHACLQAIIFHIDDANPLNNLGQHNTDIVEGTGAKKSLKFIVHNVSKGVKTVQLRADAYKLPAEPLRARDEKERTSLEHLRRLQAANNARKFPVPEFLQLNLSETTFELGPERTREIALELTEPPPGSGEIGVNVHAVAGDELIGGITAYVGKGP
ncbi:MAG: hypothetical protein WAO00_19030 [Chthoniobacterales bacterium]